MTYLAGRRWNKFQRPWQELPWCRPAETLNIMTCGHDWSSVSRCFFFLFFCRDAFHFRGSIGRAFFLHLNCSAIKHWEDQDPWGLPACHRHCVKKKTIWIQWTSSWVRHPEFGGDVVILGLSSAVMTPPDAPLAAPCRSVLWSSEGLTSIVFFLLPLVVLLLKSALVPSRRSEQK